MSEHKENFKCWFSDIIERLYKNENAGFPILMLAFPLLERYLRSKSGIPFYKSLNDDFHKELIKLFPVLKEIQNSKNFWTIYRDGILHQATFSNQKYNVNKRTTIEMPDGWLSGDTEAIEIDSKKTFWVNPVKFAEIVINTIYNDFLTFEASNSSDHPPLATKQEIPDGLNGTCGHAEKLPPSVIMQNTRPFRR